MPQTTGRKVPIRPLAVNSTGLDKVTRGAFIAVIGCLAGCGPIVRVAPFVERPDSIKPGSLLGPYDGQVVDADTQQPLAEALVSCTWAFDRGLGTPAPDTHRTYAQKTDVDGRYHIPALRSFPQGLTARLARVSFVVYKKEYVAYRHDHVFPEERQRSDFAQRGNLVKLARWSPELSHAQHLLFLGGGQGLEAASSWEVLAAAAELDQGNLRLGVAPGGELGSATSRPTATSTPSLDASVLLSSDDVREVTGYSGQFTAGRLAGERSSGYDSFHLRAVERPERYDVALRLWRPGAGKLNGRYEELLNTLPGSKQNDEVADRSFTVRQGEILGLGFLDRAREAVVLLTCGRGQCTKESQLLELGQRVAKNLSKLPPVGTEDGSGTSEPESEP